ncbi:MAG: cyclase family protein [Chloroflexota bacterium]
MTGRLIDISVPLETALPTWPGSRGHRTFRTMAIESGDAANVTQLEMDVHTGTHVENSLHFLADGSPLAAVALERLVGPALVAEIAGPAVTPATLEEAAIPPHTSRLLLKTTNSALWHALDPAFDPSYVALTEEAAHWLVDHDVEVVGIDYLSVQRFEDSPETHRILMRAGITIIEGLDLTNASAGIYDMVCLPLHLSQAEAAPARVILIDRKPAT